MKPKLPTGIDWRKAPKLPTGIDWRKAPKEIPFDKSLLVAVLVSCADTAYWDIQVVTVNDCGDLMVLDEPWGWEYGHVHYLLELN